LDLLGRITLNEVKKRIGGMDATRDRIIINLPHR
jgi:hypothetical protein